MTKVFKFLSWAILIALCVGLASCSKDEGGSDDIVGKWQIYYNSDGLDELCDYEDWFEFKSDGTYTEFDKCDNETVGGTWKREGNNLTIVAEYFPIPIVFTIVSLSKDELVLESNIFHKITAKYKRI